MTDRPTLFWYRNDLRVDNNPALQAAIVRGAPILALYVLDDETGRKLGAAARWWLHHSLEALAARLADSGVSLTLRKGNAAQIIEGLVADYDVEAVYWNRRYFAPHIEADKALKQTLGEAGCAVESFNGGLLREPWEVKTASGGPYKVYSPFWKSVRELGPACGTRKTRFRKSNTWPSDRVPSDKLDDWALTPAQPDWAKGFSELWTPGEKGAAERLNTFLCGAIEQYKEGRDHPSQSATSRLSPHLAFGEISPAQIWEAVCCRRDAGDITAANAEKFLSELAWRDFAYNLLFQFPELPSENLRSEFDHYPWRDDEDQLAAWRRGKTGYPIVDAGMRELWQTGWMHNRVRMVVASFLIKHLQIHWSRGEEWFWDTLVDADIANNSASWQWVAGSGADAAPYFRIFNPVTQGEKFDPDGDYVRRFVPELSEMPNKFIHKPWAAPEDVLEKAGVVLGKHYPNPIVEHKVARERALAGYDKVKNSA